MMKLLGAAAVVGLLGCSGEPAPAGDASFPADPFATVQSEDGALVVEVRTAPDQPPPRGLADVELRVRDGSGAPASDLDVDVEPWMLDMGHGAPTDPVVAAEGEGRYTASGVNFFMPGRWELRVTFGGGLVDRAAVQLQIP
jgi:hypothetical protein